MHVIQHLRIEALVDDQAMAQRLQDDLSRWCRTEAFWQRVSDRLDELVPAGMVLHIDRLELDIHTLDRELFMDTLFEELADAIETTLQYQNNAVPQAEHLRKLVMHFLINGYLPASACYADELAVQAFLGTLAGLDNGAFGAVFRQELARSPQILTRMMHYAGQESTRRFLLATLLESSEIEAPLSWIAAFFEGQNRHLKTTDAEAAQWERTVWNYLFEYPAGEAFASEKVLGEALGRIREQMQFEEHPGTDDSRHPQSNEGVFYIRNAGIVLLAPFFSQLFKVLEWTENSAWKTETEMSLAVRLIGQIGTGADEDWEYNWVLAKILCGVLPETVIDCETPLPQEALDLSVSMMEAAIDQWKVLKSTTPAGLCELFIHRDGKLSRDDEGTGWRLQVEKKSQDALLERLPWGISVIRLPWMKDMLLVEW